MSRGTCILEHGSFRFVGIRFRLKKMIWVSIRESAIKYRVFVFFDVYYVAGHVNLRRIRRVTSLRPPT